MDSYRREAIQESNARDVISPKLAAIGVATLSGLIFKNLDREITAAVMTPKKNKFLWIIIGVNFAIMFFFRLLMSYKYNKKTFLGLIIDC